MPTVQLLSPQNYWNVKADSFGNDRGNGGRQWIALGEILIFNVDLSNADIQKMRVI